MIMRYYIKPTELGRHLSSAFYEKFDHKMMHVNRRFAYRVFQDSFFPYEGEFYIRRNIYRYPLSVVGTSGFDCTSCGELVAEIYDRFEQAR